METTVGLSEGNGAWWEGLEHGGSGYWVVGKWEWHWCAVGMVWSCLIAGLLVGSLLKKGGRECVCVRESAKREREREKGREGGGRESDRERE